MNLQKQKYIFRFIFSMFEITAYLVITDTSFCDHLDKNTVRLLFDAKET